MNSNITLEQIKSLNNDYLHNLDLSEPEALIFNFYGVTGKEAYELYQTATLTQENLLAGVGAIAALLHHILTESNQRQPHNLECVKTALLMLPDMISLSKGINQIILHLRDEAKQFDHNKP